MIGVVDMSLVATVAGVVSATTFAIIKIYQRKKKTSAESKNERYKKLREHIFDKLASLNLQTVNYNGEPRDALKLYFN
jgi:hypothetical protein